MKPFGRKVNTELPKKTASRRPPVFVYLGYLLVATMLVTGVTFAGYVSTSSGGDEARVAKFEVTDTSDLLTASLNVSISPGEEKIVPLEVENKSEVAIDYTINIDNVYNNLPLEFYFKDGAGNALSAQGSDGSTGYEFTGVLNAGENGNFDLVIVWPEANDSTAYVDKVDIIDAYVSAVQKD